MNNFVELTPNELDENLFNTLAKDWLLVTAGDTNDYNTMTISWGGFGVMWQKNTATIVVRPQRHTYDYIEKNDLFTLTVFPKDMHNVVEFCGKHSGRDVDKAKECNITAVEVGGSTSFEEARLILLCKKLYFNDLVPENFVDQKFNSTFYPKNDHHRMYIAEILTCFEKKAD